MGRYLKGERCVIDRSDERYPEPFKTLAKPPKRLFVLGDPAALEEGLAVVGARKATPYGLGCAARFAAMASERGICIISGGARGCDAKAHLAALEGDGRTVVFLGSGADHAYPACNYGMFQRIIDSGGALVSEYSWETTPQRWMFRERNRLIASLAKATLIVEAGLPSGTFSTADDAVEANRDVLVVPGAITSANSMGANLLISQGAIPVIGDECFHDLLDSLFESVQGTSDRIRAPQSRGSGPFAEVRSALMATPMSLEEMREMLVPAYGDSALSELMVWLATEAKDSRIARYPDGKYGPSA